MSNGITQLRGARVLVTGGASFIGSHLVDALVERGARVAVLDDLSTGKRENLAGHLEADRIRFTEADLLAPGIAAAAVEGQDVVFHLAADHGGRGYVELHQSAGARNLAIDGVLFQACLAAGVGKVVYASSACVYPTHLQADLEHTVYLREDMVGPPFDADNLYGWAKLMGEEALRAYHREQGLRAVSCRYFTVYGPRATESHAVMAMIARAFIGQDPFHIWGTGRQVRNWTYVSDIVEGTLAAAERVDDGRAINLGTTERTRVEDAARAVLRRTGVEARLEPQPHMPVGPPNRVADDTLARELLGWEPKLRFEEGLQRTIDWYFATKDRDQVRDAFESLLEL